MNKIFLFLILFILSSTCIVAPDFTRTSEYDLKGGVPYIRNFQYNFTPNGLYFGWIDGSLDNHEYILTQKLYSGSDSLIKELALPGEASHYLETNKKYGFPHYAIISSNNIDSNGNITDQRKETLSINFGSIALNSPTVRNEFLEIRIRINDFNPAIQSIILDIDKGQGWERFSSLLPNQNLFKYPESELDQVENMRFGIVINDFNDQELIVDSIILSEPF